MHNGVQIVISTDCKSATINYQMVIASYLNWLRAVTVRGVQGGHLIGHPNYWYATISFSLFNTERSVYFSLELKDATRLVFCIAIHLVYFQPLNHTTCFFLTERKTLESRKDIENNLTDKTEQVTFENRKQSHNSNSARFIRNFKW